MLVHIIDDNASVRRAVKRLLGSVGIDAVTYSSAQRFLDSEPADVPSCLVLDVRMPRLSGLELQDQLIAAGRAVPIVFITGHGDIAMAVEAMKKGAVDFLPKPFNDQDLIDAIHRALDQHERLRDEQAERDEILARLERLTPREREVMELVITGLLNKQVAGELGTTEKTIKVHRARVMDKMEAASLAELVRLAARVDVHGPA
jgi:RNA polymerase sigma factor (sigma-70 family)